MSYNPPTRGIPTCQQLNNTQQPNNFNNQQFSNTYSQEKHQQSYFSSQPTKKPHFKDQYISYNNPFQHLSKNYQKMSYIPPTRGIPTCQQLNHQYQPVSQNNTQQPINHSQPQQQYFQAQPIKQNVYQSYIPQQPPQHASNIPQQSVQQPQLQNSYIPQSYKNPLYQVSPSLPVLPQQDPILLEVTGEYEDVNTESKQASQFLI